MNTNRELDKAVAEKVMGWEIVNPVKPAIHDMFGYPPDSKERLRIPFYSSNQSDAMSVIRRIDELDEIVQATFYRLYDGFNLKEIKPGEPIPLVRIDPTEICEAALKAVNSF